MLRKQTVSVGYENATLEENVVDRFLGYTAVNLVARDFLCVMRAFHMAIYHGENRSPSWK